MSSSTYTPLTEGNFEAKLGFQSDTCVESLTAEKSIDTHIHASDTIVGGLRSSLVDVDLKTAGAAASASLSAYLAPDVDDTGGVRF